MSRLYFTVYFLQEIFTFTHLFRFWLTVGSNRKLIKKRIIKMKYKAYIYVKLTLMLVKTFLPKFAAPTFFTDCNIINLITKYISIQ